MPSHLGPTSTESTEPPSYRNGHENWVEGSVPQNKGLQLTRGAWSWGILPCRPLARAGFGCEALVKVGPLQLKPSVGRTRACGDL